MKKRYLTPMSTYETVELNEIFLNPTSPQIEGGEIGNNGDENEARQRAYIPEQNDEDWGSLW